MSVWTHCCPELFPEITIQPGPITDPHHSWQLDDFAADQWSVMTAPAPSGWLLLVSLCLCLCWCWLSSLSVKVCVVLAQRNAAFVSMRARCQETEWLATSRPASGAPTLPSCWRQRQVISCVSDLQPLGWRRSSPTWTAKPTQERHPTCNHGNATSTIRASNEQNLAI